MDRLLTFKCRPCGVAASASWLACAAAGAAVLFCEWYQLLPLVNLLVGMSAALTVLWKLGRVIAPVSEAYRMGFDAGYAEGRRVPRPTVIPFPSLRLDGARPVQRVD